jgi:hypothetical protein
MGHFIKFYTLIKLKLLRSYLAAKGEDLGNYKDHLSLYSYLIIFVTGQEDNITGIEYCRFS